MWRMAKQLRKRPAERPRHYVKEWRTYRQLTQDQLADRVDKSRGLIAQIEGGLTGLTDEMMFALAEAMSCEPWDIWRVNPLKDGIVVDITDALRGESPEIQAEALGFVRGLVSGSRH